MNMARYRRRLTLAIAALGCLFSFLLPAVPAFAKDVLENSCKDVPTSTLCQDNKPQDPGSNDLYGPNGILTKVTDILAYVVGIASIIVVTIGGIRYGISSGDANNVNGAKNTILFALIGLAVAILAKAVVIFVLVKIG